MRFLEAEELVRAFQWRYASKKFDPSRRIEAAEWAALEEILVLSPSSFGLQPWKFFVVTDQSLKDALVPLSWGQKQLADASHIVVFAVKHPLTAADVRRHVERTAEVQGVSVETLVRFEKVVRDYVEQPDFDVQAWSSRQVYIALGSFMTAAALLGIDTCPMEGLDPVGYDKILGLEGTGYFTIAACPAGYRADDDKSASRAKVRFPSEHVVQRLGP